MERYTVIIINGLIKRTSGCPSDPDLWHKGNTSFQAAFIALRKDGKIGSATMNTDNFQYVVSRPDSMKLFTVKHK